jgi:chemotaxis protein methyltransferase CheR
MGLKKIASTDQLVSLLSEDDAIFDEFLDKLTINVTEFFRDPPFWQNLVDLLETYNHKALKSWSAGCSIGCEPYTLAMLMLESHLQHSKIWATDMDKGALQKAQKGIYSADEVKNVPPSYKKYFDLLEDGTYSVKPIVKEQVTFQQHNLLQDSFPVSEMDLVLCRNVVIYFGRDIHEKLWSQFASALKPGGILFVGASEIIFDPVKYGLSLISHGFYRKL